MTTKSFDKVLVQLENKPANLEGKKLSAKAEKVHKHNAPKKRAYGKGVTKCDLCGSHRAHISSYGLSICRKCFRLNAPKFGFKKID